jgi:aspartoacylase
MDPIKRIAIIGGTHGNELTGAYLIKKFEQSPDLVTRSNFETVTLFGNPRAFEVGRRYIDKDLNRCFLLKDLLNPTLSSYEDLRAKTIHQILGPKGQPVVDLILDLHSTTANMGMTVILSSHHPFNLRLAAYLSQLDPSIKFFSWAQSSQDSSLLRSLCDLGCAIEVGPVAQGVLQAAIFQQTETLVYRILDYLEKINHGQIPDYSSFTLYQFISAIDYPRDEDGNINAMIHPQLQDQDYQALHPGDPIFLTFDNQPIVYQGQSTVYPVFINEAAYYEKGVAVYLAEKQQITVANG